MLFACLEISELPKLKFKDDLKIIMGILKNGDSHASMCILRVIINSKEYANFGGLAGPQFIKPWLEYIARL